MGTAESNINGKADAGHKHTLIQYNVNITGYGLRIANTASFTGGTGGWLDIMYNTSIASLSLFAYHDSTQGYFGTIRQYQGNLYLSVDNDSAVGVVSNKSGGRPIYASEYLSNSSRRYKENITPISDDSVKRLLDVEVCNYDYKKNIVPEQRRFGCAGLIAEDITDVFPNVVVYKDINGESLPDAIDYSKFVPYLIRMIQIQNERIEKLEELCN